MAASKDHHQCCLVPWVCLRRQARTAAAPYPSRAPLHARPRLQHIPHLPRMGVSHAPILVLIIQECWIWQAATRGGVRAGEPGCREALALVGHGAHDCNGGVPPRDAALGDCDNGHAHRALGALGGVSDRDMRGDVDVRKLGAGEPPLSAVGQTEVRFNSIRGDALDCKGPSTIVL